MLTYLFYFVILCGGVYLINKTAAGRIFSSIVSWFGSIGRWFQNRDPVALMKQGVDERVQYIEDAWKALEQKDIIISRLTESSKGKEREINNLEALSKHAVNNGKDDEAKRYLVQLVKLQKAHANDIEQLEKHEQEYEDFRKNIDAKQQEILNIKREAADLGVALNIAESEAKLDSTMVKINNNLNVDSFNEAKVLVEDRIHAARATSRVSRDRNRTATELASMQSSADELEAEEMLKKLKG